jgi:DNA-binding IclR family transcriptional regulator
MGSALQKAIAVLEAAVTSPRNLRLTELARETGLSRQSAHRILRQLEASGLVQHEALHDSYLVGPRLKQLSFAALAAAQRGGAGHEVLADLVSRVGESCNIGMLDGREVVYVDRVECDWPLRLQLQPGSRLPAHCSAIGKLLLAFLEPEARGRLLDAAPLARHTANTETDPARLRRELDRIRAEHAAINDQEYMAGLLGIAVPIHDGAGRVVAGLAVHAPVARMNRSQAVAHLPALRAAARKLDRIFELEFGPGC